MKRFIVFFMLGVLIALLTGCNEGIDDNSTPCFTATYFPEMPYEEIICFPITPETERCLVVDWLPTPAYWMLERGGARYFILDRDLPGVPAPRTTRQAGRPDDGVGERVPAPDLIVDEVTVITSDALYVCLTWEEVESLALPWYLFDEDGYIDHQTYYTWVEDVIRIEWPDFNINVDVDVNVEIPPFPPYPEWPDWPEWPEFPEQPPCDCPDIEIPPCPEIPACPECPDCDCGDDCEDDNDNDEEDDDDGGCGKKWDWDDWDWDWDD